MTITAVALIGQGSNSGGIRPSRKIELYEGGDRPVFMLDRLSGNFRVDPYRNLRLWPTRESALDELIFMILYISEVREIMHFMEVAGLHERVLQNRTINMYEDFGDQQRADLYKLVKENSTFSKIMLSVFDGSILLETLAHLEDYQCEIEVQQTVYRKDFARLTADFVVTGSL